MPQYELRDDRGQLKAHISQEFANNIIGDVIGNGHWEPYRVPGKPERSKFVFDDDLAFFDNHVKIFMWKGDYIVNKS